MMPIGPLMIEHRLIERMVDVLDNHVRAVEGGGGVDPDLLRTAVDFFRIYADRTHHGKEEDILFRDLVDRPLGDEHRRVMNELTEEHKVARRLVGALDDAGEHLRAGDGEAARSVCDRLRELIALYRPHIEKEDEHFFMPVMAYLSADEQEEMLEAFRVFDAGMIHEKYKQVVDAAETTRAPAAP
ncbi:MAG: hemerythrin domain-containing protein [Planctomycetota bacterium]